MATGLIVLALIVTATSTAQPSRPDPCNTVVQTEEGFALCELWEADADFWKKIAFMTAEVVERYRETNRKLAFEAASANDALEDYAQAPAPDPIEIKADVLPDWVIPVGIGVLAGIGGFALGKAL